MANMYSTACRFNRKKQSLGELFVRVEHVEHYAWFHVMTIVQTPRGTS